MITPNKAISIEESVLSKLSLILRTGPSSLDLVELFHCVASQFESIDEFLLALDTLYVLGNIDIDFSERSVNYAG